MRQRRKCIVLALVMALTLSNFNIPQVEAKSKTPSVKKSNVRYTHVTVSIPLDK